VRDGIDGGPAGPRGPTTANCPFCAIVRGDAEATVVHEDAEFVAFLDIRPATPGHLLVATRRHVHYLDELPDDAGVHLLEVADRLRRAIRATPGLGSDVKWFLSDGEDGYTDIPHVHLHLFPRSPDDDVSPSAGTRLAARSELDALGAEIRRALAVLPPEHAVLDLPAGPASIFLGARRPKDVHDRPT
jgi:histidine triad (HIT) family protein